MEDDLIEKIKRSLFKDMLSTYSAAMKLPFLNLSTKFRMTEDLIEKYETLDQKTKEEFEPVVENLRTIKGCLMLEDIESICMN